MADRPHPIDVWDVGTFDPALVGELDSHEHLVRQFLTTSERIWIEREESDHTHPYPVNPYSADFIEMSDQIGRRMSERTIRAWHYTRMTDDEIAALLRDGIHMSTTETLRARLATQVASGALMQDVADRIYEDSPFQSDQLESRSNKFWMVSHPHRVDDGGVELLLESWGGEVAYFWQRDPQLQLLLRQIGRPRVLEVAVPLNKTRDSSSAGSAVIASYGRMLGCNCDRRVFDLYTEHPLSSDHILAVHSEDETDYALMARGYPTGFIDDYPDG